MAAPSLHHLALRTRDVAACAGFYRDVIGLRETKRALLDDGALRSVWLAATGGPVVMVELAAPDEPTVAPGSLELIAFTIGPTERDAWRERLVFAGVPIEAETAHTLYVRDPDGRRVGVSSYAFG